MGCDIHFHTEVKVNGKWEHYSNPRVDRSYELFTLLCNVRSCSWIDPFLYAPNGVNVDDLNIITQKTLIEDEDNHSFCLFDYKTICAFYKYVEKNYNDYYRSMELDFFGFLEGNSWDSRENFPEWVEDVRWIFAFDN